MAVSSGFFNSVNHDRLYDAEQVSSIFDGIISDGVYDGFGDSFNVSPNIDAANTVFVDSGRAWFNHTWTLNDARIVVQLPQPNPMTPRMDAVVIDVDRTQPVRKNTIIAVEGTPSADPQPPTMIHEDRHDQYPIAYVTRPAGDDGIVASQDIKMNIGTESCPRVVGILEALNDDQYWQKLEADFNVWWDGIKDLIGGDTEDSLIGLSNRIDELEDKVEESTINEKGEIGNYQVLFTKTMTKAIVEGSTGNSVSTNSYNIVDLYYGTDDMKQGIGILPDGYAFDMAHSDGKLMVSVTNTSGVQVTTNSYSGRTDVWVGDFNFIISANYNGDSYPVTIPVSMIAYQSSVIEPDYDAHPIYTCWFNHGTVTITEDHIISFNITEDTYTSIEFTQTNTQHKGNYFFRPDLAAYTPDGSRIGMVGYGAYTTGNDDLGDYCGVSTYFAYKLLMDGTLELGPDVVSNKYVGGDGVTGSFVMGACNGKVYNINDNDYVTVGETSVASWYSINPDTLAITFHKSDPKPSISRYRTFYKGTFSSLNMSTKKYKNTIYNEWNTSTSSTTDFEYPNIAVIYDRGLSFSNSDNFVKQIEMPDGTIDYILYGASGIDHFILNPLTNIAVAENKLNVNASINFAKASLTKYHNRSIADKRYYLNDRTVYII